MSTCQPPTARQRVACTNGLELSRLCQAVAAVSHAPCEQLGNEEYVANVIRSAGLVATIRGCRLYGAECKHMTAGTFNASGKEGFFQLPRQIASAMVHVGRLGVRSYLELGVYSGWTASLMTAYLARFSPSPFRSFTMDRTDQHIAPRTATVMRRLGIKLHLRRARSSGVPTELERGLRSLDTPVGLCFIDAGHSYGDVRNDFEQLSPWCSLMLFHDTFDFDLWATKDHGVPGFWHHLKANVPPSRIVEFHGVETVFPPTLGLGLLLPNETGSVAVALTKPWHVGGAFATTPSVDVLPCTGIGCSYDLGVCYDEGLPEDPEFCARYRPKTCACPLHHAQWICQKTCGWCPMNTTLRVKHHRRAGTMRRGHP